MAIVNVSDGIFWVGALDPDLRDFHGFEVEEGSTYNSYLVRGAEKIALVDSVNTTFVPQVLERIKEIVPLDSIDYIVINHIEPDHGGGLVDLMAAIPGAEVLCSPGSARAIPEFHGPGIDLTVVGPTDVIDLGGKTLRFMPMPMVHWPDSMFTYVAESKTLLPNDAFGQHLCTDERFADEVGYDRVLDAADLYYANILMPLTGPISKALGKIAENEWEIETIAPSHGLIWRGEGVEKVLDHYSRLLSGENDGSVVLVFSTAWHSTEMMAEYIAERLRAAGVKVESFDLASAKKSFITKAILRGRMVVMGSPTLHNAMLTPNAAYLHYLTNLKPAGKLGAVFGSYGWSSGATAQMRAAMEAMGISMPFEDLQVKYRPLEADLPVIDAWVDSLVEALR